MSQVVNGTDDQQEGDPLHLLLVESLKTENQTIDDIEQKLKAQGVSHDDMMQFLEKDLRDTLAVIMADIQMKPLFIGRIVKYLRTIPQSAVFQENQKTKFVKIYVSPQENKAFADLSKAHKHASDAAHNIQTQTNKLTQNQQKTLKSIDATFSALHEELDKRKSVLQNEITVIVNKKGNILNEQLNKWTAYRNALQSAKKEYHKTLENASLSDVERADKNVSDIQKAIEGELKYDIADPLVSDQVLFEYEDQYKELCARINQFGSIVGFLAAPTINITDITRKTCKVLVAPSTSNEPNVKKRNVEKYEIKYNKIEANDAEDEKQMEQVDDVHVVRLDGNQSEVTIEGLSPTCKYKFCARAYYEQMGFTAYSKGIIMEVKKERQLGWDRQHHGNGITFVSDQRIKYSTQRAACIADYVVKKANHDRFEWSVQIHQYSNSSWIGFVDAKKLNTLNYNTHIASNQHCTVGPHINATSLTVCGPGKAGSPTTTAMKNGDILKFVADLNKKEMTLYHNDKSLGVVWKNIYDEFIPAASNNQTAAEYTIIGTVLV
eukprot:391340_1